MSTTGLVDLRDSDSSIYDARDRVKYLGLSESEYTTTTQKYIEVIAALRALGAEADLTLPRIVVIGNQSAGKSSLVEALSSISLPRNAQTCTRCPMECRLKHSSQPWSCQILLRRSDGSDLSVNVREEQFGALVTNKSELELMIRRAQLAILNPSQPVSTFLKMSGKELEDGLVGQQQFSRDVICLDISGPDVTNLIFIDLPGLITNHKSNNNVTLVEKMVEEFIQGDTIILLTVTMREDINLQRAVAMAKEADPQGLRTIGVLTKPDTLQEGEEDFWLEMLLTGQRGEEYKLHHGYFITKQPALSELKEMLSHAEARERERLFFENTSPWNALSPHDRSRMGVPMLANELNLQLIQLIQDCLPDLSEQARKSLNDTIRRIDALPPLPKNPVIELSKIVSDFTSVVKGYILGAPSYERIAQVCRKANTTFSGDILSTRPNFVPRMKLRDNNNVEMRGDFPEVETIEEAVGVSCQSKPIFLDELHMFLESTLTRELPFNIPFSAKAELIQDCFATWPKHCNGCFTAIETELQKLLVELVDTHFSQYKRGGLHGKVRRIIEAELHHHSKKTRDRVEWLLKLENPPFTKNDGPFATDRKHLLVLFREKYKKGNVPQGIATQSEPRTQPLLIPAVSASVGSFMQQPQGPANPPGVGCNNNLMQAPPLAYDYNANRNGTLAQGQATQSATQFSFPRTFSSMPSPQPPQMFAQGMEGDGHRLRQEANNVSIGVNYAREMEVDPYEQSLVTMAEVSAYFRIAYKRIIDNVPRIIDHDFLRAFLEAMHNALNTGLGMGERNAYQRAENYLREEPGVLATRKKLTGKKERLEEIVERLDKFHV